MNKISAKKAIAALQQNAAGGPLASPTAADALRGLPLAKERERTPAVKQPVREPTDPFELGPVRKVEQHAGEGDSRLALRSMEDGEFVSPEEARMSPESVVTDYVAKRKPAAKKAAKKTAKKAAKKVAKSAAKKATKKAVKKAARKATKKAAKK